MNHLIDQILAKAQAVVDTVTTEGRKIRPEESLQIRQYLDRIDQLKTDDAITAQIEDMRGNGRKTVGRGPVAFPAEQYKAFGEGIAQGQPVTGLKATVTIGTGAVPPAYANGAAVTVAREAFRLRDLFPIEPTEAPSVFYRRIATGAAQAATTAEGALKPEATIVAEQVEAPIRKIATFLPVSEEALADGGEQFVRDMIDDLTRDLIGAENRQLLSGNGTTPNLRGLLSTTGIQTRARGTDSNLDAILRAGTMLRTVAFLEPDAVLVHPANWETIRLAKASGGEYLLGDPLAQGQPQLLGAPVHVTTDAPLGTALVLNASEAARVYLREDIRVDMGMSGDGFQRNIRAARVETRLALAVRRPAAVVSVTGLA